MFKGSKMSYFDSEITVGSIKYENKFYEIFTNPINNKIKQSLTKFINKNGFFTTAPWKYRKFLWEIKENKLFLKKILVNFSLKNCKWQDITKNILNQDEVFANWVNQELKLLILKKPFYFPERKRDILYLKFKNGILDNSYIKEEIYTLNGLKHYFLLELYSRIGVFWIYEDKFYKKSQVIAQGIKQDDLIYPLFSLKDVWEEVRCKDYMLYYFDYDKLPNGVIAFDEKYGKFIIFTKKEVIDNEVYKYLIISNFNLKDEFVEFRLIGY